MVTGGSEASEDPLLPVAATPTTTLEMGFGGTQEQGGCPGQRALKPWSRVELIAGSLNSSYASK